MISRLKQTLPGFFILLAALPAFASKEALLQGIQRQEERLAADRSVVDSIYAIPDGTPEDKARDVRATLERVRILKQTSLATLSDLRRRIECRGIPRRERARTCFSDAEIRLFDGTIMHLFDESIMASQSWLSLKTKHALKVQFGQITRQLLSDSAVTRTLIENGMASYTASESANYVPPTDFAVPREFTGENPARWEFSELGIPSATSITERDNLASASLVHQFYAPRLQGQGTYTCGGFSIASDMETFPGVPLLSAGLIHGYSTILELQLERNDGLAFKDLLTPRESLPSLFNYGIMSRIRSAVERVRFPQQMPHAIMHARERGMVTNLSLAALMTQFVAPESSLPYVGTNGEHQHYPTDVNGLRLNELTDRTYGVESYARLLMDDVPEGTPTIYEFGYDYRWTKAFLVALIDQGHAPMIHLNRADKRMSEDWYYISESGSLGHALNLVGYGEAINPETLLPTRYFLVRDSLVSEPIYYRVPERDLITNLVGVMKVIGLRRP